MDIEIGAAVWSKDNRQVGEVHRFVVDLEQQAVVSMVVLKGRFLPRDILVPLDFIDTAQPGRVTLDLTRAEVERLPDFSYDKFFAAPPTWALPIVYPGGVVYIPVSQRRRLSTSQQDLAPGTKVQVNDGEIGTVDRVELDATGHLDAFWVRPASRSYDLRIPVEWIARLDGTGIHLATSRAELETDLADESLARSDR
jgi:hypothetical protein